MALLSAQLPWPQRPRRRSRLHPRGTAVLYARAARARRVCVCRADGMRSARTDAGELPRVHDFSTYDCRDVASQRLAMLWYEQGPRRSAWSSYLQVITLLHSLSLHAARPLLFATTFAPGQRLRDMRLPAIVRYCNHLATAHFYCEILNLPPFAPSALTEAAQHPLLSRLNLFRLTQCSRVVSIDSDMLVVRPLAPLFSMPLDPHKAPFAALCCADVQNVRWRPNSTKIVNGGLLVIAPSKQGYEALQAPHHEAMLQQSAWPGRFAHWLQRFMYDQPWLAMAFGDNVTSLPKAFNLVEAGCRLEDESANATLRELSDATVLHFKGSAKPLAEYEPHAPVDSNEGMQCIVSMVSVNSSDDASSALSSPECERWLDVRAAQMFGRKHSKQADATVSLTCLRRFLVPWLVELHSAIQCDGCRQTSVVREVCMEVTPRSPAGTRAPCRL